MVVDKLEREVRPWMILGRKFLGNSLHQATLGQKLGNMNAIRFTLVATSIITRMYHHRI